MRTVTGRQERGAVIVVVALSMVVLLLFAALAVDYGIAATQRRKSQNTADAGALGGGQLLLSRDGGAPVTNDEIADAVIDITWENLLSDASFTEADSITRADWEAMFAACTEPDPAGYPIRSAVSDCIRFSPFGSRIRVRIPTLHTTTAFARVVGIDDVAVHAVAEAELVPNGSGGVVPFGLPSSSGNDTEICLKSPSNGHAPNTGVCDDGQPGFDNEGNFGSLDISQYGNPVLGTPVECTGNTNRRLEANIALGVDHPLGEYVAGGSIRNDRAYCVDGADFAAEPNQILGQKGIGSNLDNGLLRGTDVDGRSVPGRLTRTPWTSYVVEVRNGTTIDNRPLWTFIDPTVTTPASCVRSTIEALPDVTARQAALTACIDEYKAGGHTHEIFTADDDGDGTPDLLQSPRTAFVPQLHASTWAAPDDVPQLYNIRRFRPVYLNTLYFKCTATHCDATHRPGDTGTPFPVPNNKDVEALTALLLPDDMVPQQLLDEGPSTARPRTLVLRR